VFISFFQSATSAILYIMYLPYFMMLAVFFLVYVPSYSYARWEPSILYIFIYVWLFIKTIIVIYIVNVYNISLFDTTWGNRETGRDESINNSRERIMKSGVLKFNIALVLLNAFLFLTFSYILTGSTVQIIFILVLFSPVMIQTLGATFFLIFVSPFRSIFVNREVVMHNDFSL
jgi:hypothetical protein